MIEREWEKEPNKLEWIYKGYKCIISRNPEMLNLCGYVSVPEDNVCYGKNMNNKYVSNIECHWGITFSNFGYGYNGIMEDEWWVGFDCAHAFDLVPGLELFRHMLEIESSYGMPIRDTYKNLKYAINHTERIADQLKKLKKGTVKYQKRCKNRTLLMMKRGEL